MDSDTNVESITLIQCSVCGRHFREDIINRHQSVCLKNTTKKRKVFDSTKQRTQGIPIANQKSSINDKSAEKARKLAQVEARKHNWRQKHEEFIQSIRAAKEYTIAKQTGRPLPPPPPPTIDPDLIQCEYCLRRFNEKAAERHIKFCRDKHSRLPANNATTTSSVNTGIGRGRVPARTSLAAKGDVPQNTTTNPSGSRRIPVPHTTTESDNRPSANSNFSSVRNVKRTTPQMMKPAQTITTPGARNSRDLHKTNDEMIKPPSNSSKEETVPNSNRGVPTSQTRYVHRSSLSNDNCFNFQNPKVSPSKGLNSNLTFTNDCEDLTNNTANYHHQHHSHQSKIHRTKHHKIVNSERKHDSPCSKQIPKSYETNNLNGVILRSGRTQEDYEEARELARNLMKKTPCITPPSSLSSDRKGRTSNPLIPLLRNDQSPGIKNYIYESSAYNNSGFSTKKLFSPNSISSSNSNSREHGSSWSQNSYLNNDHGDETPLGGEENNFQHRLNSQSKIQYDHISIHSPNSLQANKTANHSRNNLKPTTGAMTNDKSNKFCSECGSTFPSTAARFCPECGMRRMGF